MIYLEVDLIDFVVEALNLILTVSTTFRAHAFDLDEGHGLVDGIDLSKYALIPDLRCRDDGQLAAEDVWGASETTTGRLSLLLLGS